MGSTARRGVDRVRSGSASPPRAAVARRHPERRAPRLDTPWWPLDLGRLVRDRRWDADLVHGLGGQGDISTGRGQDDDRRALHDAALHLLRPPPDDRAAIVSGRGIIQGMSRRRLPWLVAVPLIVGSSFFGARPQLPHRGARCRVESRTSARHGPWLPDQCQCPRRPARSAPRGYRASRPHCRPGRGRPAPLGWALLPPSSPRIHHAGAPRTSPAQRDLSRSSRHSSRRFSSDCCSSFPFALAAYVVAWALLDVADRLGASVRVRARRRWRVSTIGLRPPEQLSLAPIPAAALGYAQRGPAAPLSLTSPGRRDPDSPREAENRQPSGRHSGRPRDGDRCARGDPQALAHASSSSRPRE